MGILQTTGAIASIAALLLIVVERICVWREKRDEQKRPPQG
jgi:hypothetical protein